MFVRCFHILVDATRGNRHLVTGLADLLNEMTALI